jgi:hypothetical protein
MATEPKSEWIEKRDVNGHLMFLYSPARDVIRFRRRGIETEVNLIDLKREGYVALTCGVVTADVK